MRSVLTADLGGTKCRFALVTDDGRVHARPKRSTLRDADALLALIVDELRAAAADLPPGAEAPVAVGVGTAGVVGRDNNRVLFAPNIPFVDVALGDRIGAGVGLPVTVLNDGRASALGEWRYGEATGADPMLVLFFGTGVGIGLIVDGEPYQGATSAAGEIGHTIHRPGGRPGPDGRAGTFEAYCGGGPIGKRAGDELGPAPSGDREWRIDELLAAAARDDRAALIIDEARTAACTLVANATTLLNPAAIVLGGGLLTGWPDLFDDIGAFVRSTCKPVVTGDLRIVRSRLGSDAILLGAATATRAW